jgi:hypothetical protein
VFYTLLYFVCSKSDDVFSPAQKCTSFRLKIIFSEKKSTNEFLDTQTTDKNNVLFSSSSRSSVCDCSSFLLSLFVLKIGEEVEEVKSTGERLLFFGFGEFFLLTIE